MNKAKKQVVCEKRGDEFVVYVKQGKQEYFRVTCDTFDRAVMEASILMKNVLGDPIPANRLVSR